MTEEAQAPSQGTEAPPQEAPLQEAPPQGQQAVPEQQTLPEPQTPEGEQAAPVERVVPAADGYTFEEGTPEQLGEIFNQLDMTQEQADGVIKLDRVRAEAQAQALRQAGEAHIEQWGDAKQTNINLAKRGLDYFDPSGQLKGVLDQTGFGNDPRLLEMFFQFGKRMEEGGFLPSEVNTPQGQKQDTAHLWYPEQAPGKNNPYKT